MDFGEYDAKLTGNLKTAIDKANWVSAQNGVAYVGSEHLIYAFLSMQNCVAYRILSPKVQFSAYENAFIRHLDKNETTKSLTPRTKNILFRAVELASKEREKAGTAHFLFATLEEEKCMACKLLRSLGVDTAELKHEVAEMLRAKPYMKENWFAQKIQTDNRIENRANTSDFNNSANQVRATSAENQAPENRNYTQPNPAPHSTQEKSNEKTLPNEKLASFGIDLTERAKKGKLDPVIGREKEIEKMVQVLCRRSKNNPVLIGEPGVGKSAIVEGLAQLVVSEKVPEQLYNKKVFSVDLAGMIAGAKYRGEFEERLKTLMQMVMDDGDILLFIDEIHTLVGAGASSDNSMDAANILKPLLARGDMQIVGATTIEEYRKYIEKDAALERRFTPIMVEEPSKEATIEILKGLRSRYEEHHGLCISDEAIESAVNLSARYITDRYLPDKAIDLIDEAAAHARIAHDGGEETEALEVQIKDKEKDLQLYKARGDYNQATIVLREIQELKDKIESEKSVREMKMGADGRYVLGSEQIAAIISAKTKIPLTKITQAEGEKLLHLEEELHKRIVGQNEAVSAVARAIRRARAGLKDPSRPIGSFIFVGPTGVGKTDLCKALAETLFGSEEQMIRLDMSEYMEKSSVSKLIGAAPGYVGYDDLQAGQLTEKVRTKPYCVVLFDEIEKAHPDVFNLLLQLLDDGRLTDNRGRTVSFKNAVLILTSNVGAAADPNTTLSDNFAYRSFDSEVNMFKAANEKDAELKSYEMMKERITTALKEKFRPEFLNRLDDVIVFHRLSLSDVERIGGKLIDSLATRLLEQRGIVLSVTDEAKRELAEEGYEPELGARELKRVVQRKIEDRLSEEILLGRVSAGMRVTVDYKNGQFVFFGGMR